MLNEATSEIKSVAYYENRTHISITVGETIYGRPGIVITLYPVISYLQEYLSFHQFQRHDQSERIIIGSNIPILY